jgi:hypothetical protein
MNSDPFIIIKNYRKQVEAPTNQPQIVESHIFHPQKVERTPLKDICSTDAKSRHVKI